MMGYFESHYKSKEDLSFVPGDTLSTRGEKPWFYSYWNYITVEILDINPDLTYRILFKEYADNRPNFPRIKLVKKYIRNCNEIELKVFLAEQ